MLGALSIVAYLYFARAAHELLEPLLGLPEGQAAYAASMRRAAATIALFDLPLAVVVGVAAYVLARVSIRPLAAARAREERFAADAAHELRTPLATIAALAQWARQQDTTQQAAALDKIESVALDASGLLGDLLALMRQGPDDARLHEPVDVATLVTALVREAQERAGNAIGFDLTTPPNGAYVIGDARALRQLAHNLLANAARHARSRVAVDVAAPTPQVILTVEDDGDGVAPTDRERIFERFFKAQPHAPGSGLGLAICRRIATGHGGTIVLEDRARFVVRLPQAPR